MRARYLTRTVARNRLKTDLGYGRHGWLLKLNGLRILITGGAGFIGSHLVDRLIEMGNHVIVYDNFDEYYVGKEDNIKHHFENSNFTLIKADILDYNTLCKAMNEVDIVFHLAAQAGIRYSLANPLKTNTVNTSGTLNVLNSTRENRVRKVIFASSSSVYGAPQYVPVDESHPQNPISFYGVSKLAAERYCQLFNNSRELQVKILRYHTVYGPRQRPDMAIHKWTRRLFENKPPVIYGDGKQTRDFTYIDDIIDGTVKAAEIDDLEEKIFNLGSGLRVSVNTVVRLVSTLTNKEDIHPIYEEPKLGDVHDTYADISKARKILGYNPSVTLEHGVRRFIEWFEQKQNTHV